MSVAQPRRLVLADSRAAAFFLALLFVAISAQLVAGACISDFSNAAITTVLRSESNEVRLSGAVARVFSVRAPGGVFNDEYIEIDFLSWAMLDGASITTSNIVQAASLLSGSDCTAQVERLVVADPTVASRAVAVSRLVAEFSVGPHGHYQVVFDTFNDTLNLALPTGLMTVVSAQDVKISVIVSNITFDQPSYHLWTKETLTPRSALMAASAVAFSSPQLSSIDPTRPMETALSTVSAHLQNVNISHTMNKFYFIDGAVQVAEISTPDSKQISTVWPAHQVSARWDQLVSVKFSGNEGNTNTVENSNPPSATVAPLPVALVVSILGALFGAVLLAGFIAFVVMWQKKLRKSREGTSDDGPMTPKASHWDWHRSPAPEDTGRSFMSMFHKPNADKHHNLPRQPTLESIVLASPRPLLMASPRVDLEPLSPATQKRVENAPVEESDSTALPRSPYKPPAPSGRNLTQGSNIESNNSSSSEETDLHSSSSSSASESSTGSHAVSVSASASASASDSRSASRSGSSRSASSRSASSSSNSKSRSNSRSDSRSESASRSASGSYSSSHSANESSRSRSASDASGSEISASKSHSKSNSRSSGSSHSDSVSSSSSSSESSGSGQVSGESDDDASMSLGFAINAALKQK